MRITESSPDHAFSVCAIAGTRTILLAITGSPDTLDGLHGFGFHRQVKGKPATAYWLRSQKVFKSVVPDPSKKINGKDPVFTTDKHPVQSFLWSDYLADPETTYEFQIVPMYGSPGALAPSQSGTIDVSVTTEPEHDPNGHSIWFNMGAIASQAFAKHFGDIKPSTQQLEDLTQPVTKWLSRGLAEAAKAYIDDTPAGDALRACVYEFDYAPMLNAFKAALDRGVDVQICYHGTPKNDKAIAKAELPKKKGGKTVLFPRTVPKIPHNKFVVRITGGRPVAVWTGSTNMTASGFLGQSNVGHLVHNKDVAAIYLKYWKKISPNPKRDHARKAATAITPHPNELVTKDSLTVVFSPRHTAMMLDWYANRIEDAAQTVLFTAAFGVSKKLVPSLSADKDFLRFILMEKRPKKEEAKTLRADRDLMIAYGAVLGEVSRMIDGKIKKVRIKDFELDKWFKKEEHYRKAGNIFYVHTKFLLVDPLSDDPLVCTGSANFSDGSLLNNDENMLLIRGDTRVADIYLTEFDRLFRHFFFRDVANEIEEKGGKAEGAFLDETDNGPKHWTTSYFTPGSFKTRRREMFFAPGTPTWAVKAGQRPPKETAAKGDTPS